jgi:hypothetical protein
MCSWTQGPTILPGRPAVNKAIPAGGTKPLPFWRLAGPYHREVTAVCPPRQPASGHGEVQLYWHR